MIEEFTEIIIKNLFFLYININILIIFCVQINQSLLSFIPLFCHQNHINYGPGFLFFLCIILILILATISLNLNSFLHHLRGLITVLFNEFVLYILAIVCSHRLSFITSSILYSTLSINPIF